MKRQVNVYVFIIAAILFVYAESSSALSIGHNFLTNVNARFNATELYNSCFRSHARFNNTNVQDNTFIGYLDVNRNTWKNLNTDIGSSDSFNNINGCFNTFVSNLAGSSDKLYIDNFLTGDPLIDTEFYSYIMKIKGTDSERSVMTSSPSSTPTVDITQSKNLNLIGNITFYTNSDVVDSKFYLEIEKIARALLDNPKTIVIIIGYTDSVGDALNNQDLSVRRAIAVKNLLISKDIAFYRIATMGYGALNPVASNTTITDREKNRRVEIRIISSNNLMFQPEVNTFVNMTNNPIKDAAPQVSAADNQSHDERYYSETESDSFHLNIDEDTKAGDLSISGNVNKNDEHKIDEVASANGGKSLSELNNQVNKLYEEGKPSEAIKVPNKH